MKAAEFDDAFANEDFRGGNLSHTAKYLPSIKLTADFCSIGEGWLQIIHDLVRDLIKLGWDRDIHQIKEKFGGLRFYIGTGTDAMHDRISVAEAESFKTCEGCGTTENVESKGDWITTQCAPCRAERDAKRATRFG